MWIKRMSLRKSLLFFSLPITAFILAGCPYNSDTPLSSPEKAVIDEALLGTWMMKKTPDPVNTCRIVPFNEHELLIMVSEGDEPELYRAFSTEIKGVKFLNVRKIGDNSADARPWIFVNYVILGIELSVRYVEDDLPERDNLSSKAFIDVIKRNPKNPGLYGAESDSVLVRAQD